MNVANQINNIIDKIADKIGIAANQISAYIKQLYMLYIKQAYITGIQDLIWIIISTVLIIIALRIFIRSFQKPLEAHKDKVWACYDFPNTNNIDVAKRILCPIVIIVFVIIGIYCLNESISCFANSEYWAYQHLIVDLSALVNK